MGSSSLQWTHSPHRLPWTGGQSLPGAGLIIHEINLVNSHNGYSIDDNIINTNIGIVNNIIIRPHRSTMYVDVAYCYRRSSMICLSVGWSVCQDREPCKNR